MSPHRNGNGTVTLTDGDRTITLPLSDASLVWDELPTPEMWPLTLTRTFTVPVVEFIQTKPRYHRWLCALLPDCRWPPRCVLPHRLTPRGARKLRGGR